MSFLRRAERVLFWVVCLAVLAACACFIFLVLTRPADASELLFPTSEPVATVAVVSLELKPAATVAPDSVVASIWPRGVPIAHCETGGTWDPKATSRTGKYLGLFQFSSATHRSVGGDGDPRDDSIEAQTRAAMKLYQRDGAGQWPVCGR